MRADELLDGLTEPQRTAVTHGDGPLLVLAGPGSGKTRVVTHRAAYLAMTVTRPWHVLAVTFTNKAAGEMAERLERIGLGRELTCCTFHSLCARLLRIHADAAGVQPNFSIYDTADQIESMKATIEALDLSTDNFNPGRMLNTISRAKNDMILPEKYEEEADDWQARTVAEIYQKYQDILAEQNALDFDDLLVKTALLLRDRTDIREALNDRYRYVLVDEYQDTNIAQYRIAGGLALDHENLCVTGDPDQSIYAWRGANLNNILEFEADFPNATVVRLEQNYRSTPQILRAAHAVIAQNRRRKVKELWTENEQGPAVRFAQCEDALEEADYIAGQIVEHVAGGGRYGDVGILYRVNALSRQIENALRRAQVPYQIARGVAFFQRREIKDILAYLKIVVNPLDRVALLRIINVPARGIGKKSVERLVNHAEENGLLLLDVIAKPADVAGIGRAERHLESFAQLLAEIRDLAMKGVMQELTEYVILHSGLLAMWNQAENHDAVGNANELVSAAAEYDRQHADRSGTLVDWLQQISLVSDVDAVDEEAGAVTLMTMHAAKGLEFDTVFVAGVEDGLLPHRRSETETADVEEERRLFFVGMTRAQRALTLTAASYRDLRGVTRRTSRSIFTAELPGEEIEWVTVGERGRGRYDTGGAVGEDDDADLPASSVDYLEWRRGQLVRHPEFGMGRVLWIRPVGRQTRAGVLFSAYGEKTLVLEYANLELVDYNETEWDS